MRRSGPSCKAQEWQGGKIRFDGRRAPAKARGNREERKMAEGNLAILVSAAGYGMTILVLGIISLLVWLVGWLAQKISKSE
jgi:hypothetical protein